MTTSNTDPVSTTPTDTFTAEQQKRARKAYYKDQIELITPQTTLMELRSRLAKATLEHYHFSTELDKIRNGYENAPEPAVENPAETSAPGKVISMAQPTASKNPVTPNEAYEGTSHD